MAMEHRPRVHSGFEGTMEGPRGDLTQRVIVSVRVRPLTPKEMARGDEKAWVAKKETGVIVEDGYSNVDQRDEGDDDMAAHLNNWNNKCWSFDHVFDEETRTEQVYQVAVQPFIANVVKGIHGTVLMYGQTSSGKTYTMFGENDCTGFATRSGVHSQAGLVELGVRDLFAQIDQARTFEGKIATVEMSYVEVYNEVICDLLSSSSKRVAIRDTLQGVMLTSKTLKVESVNAVMSALSSGETRRHVGCTNMNEKSSRSHTILSVKVSSLVASQGRRLSAQLNFVDLAGSEGVRTSKAVGEQLKEAASINKSLLALSMIISHLARQGNHSSTPTTASRSTPRRKSIGGYGGISFRTSKLTRILKPALSGQALVSVICCITPSRRFIEETRSTLKFAQVANQVQVRAQVNETVAPELIVKKLKKELADLRASMTPSQGHHHRSSPPSVQFARANGIDGTSDLQMLQSKTAKQQAQINKLKELLFSNTRHDERPDPLVSPITDSPAHFWTPSSVKASSANTRHKGTRKIHSNAINEALQAKLRDLKEELANHKGRVDELRAVYERQLQEYREKGDKEALAQRNLHELEATNRDLISRLMKTEHSLRGANERILQLELQLQRERDGRETEAKQLEQEIHKAGSSNKRLEAIVAKLEEELRDTRRNYEDEISLQNIAKERCSIQLEELRNDLKEREDRIATLEALLVSKEVETSDDDKSRTTTIPLIYFQNIGTQVAPQTSCHATQVEITPTSNTGTNTEIVRANSKSSQTVNPTFSTNGTSYSPVVSNPHDGRVQDVWRVQYQAAAFHVALLRAKEEHSIINDNKLMQNTPNYITTIADELTTCESEATFRTGRSQQSHYSFHSFVSAATSIPSPISSARKLTYHSHLYPSRRRFQEPTPNVSTLAIRELERMEKELGIIDGIASSLRQDVLCVNDENSPDSSNRCKRSGTSLRRKVLQVQSKLPRKRQLFENNK